MGTSVSTFAGKVKTGMAIALALVAGFIALRIFGYVFDAIMWWTFFTVKVTVFAILAAIAYMVIRRKLKRRGS